MLRGRGEESRLAFRDTAIALSVLPFLAVAGVAWWLRRRVRQAAAATEATLGSEIAAESLAGSAIE